MKRPLYITIMAYLYSIGGAIYFISGSLGFITRQVSIALSVALIGAIALISAWGMFNTKYYGVILAGSLLAFQIFLDIAKLVYYSIAGFPNWTGDTSIYILVATATTWFVLLFLLYINFFTQKVFLFFEQSGKKYYFEMGKSFLLGAVIFGIATAISIVS